MNIRLLIRSPAEITGVGWWVPMRMVIHDLSTTTAMTITNRRIASFASAPSSGTMR